MNNTSNVLIDPEIINQILKITESNSLIRKETIQPLWSNYGEIYRCFLEGGKTPSVVVKHVKLPVKQNHPRGWNTNASHQRKLKSYDVETNWYNGIGKLTDSGCKIPKVISSWNKEGEVLMIMEDLNTSGYPIRKTRIEIKEIKVCLRWLACFHGKFLQYPADGLWEKGSYWHLDTRLDEWGRMEDKHLKIAASAIDNELNKAKYQTIIHGDAKLANFCFSEDGSKVAAVDFQYVGKGCGMKDIAYFLSSCLDEKELAGLETSLLNYYFKQLNKTLNKNTLKIDSQLVIDEWSALYKFAWADFYRFLNGWSPGHWKLHSYSRKMKESVLKALDLRVQK